MIRRPWTIAGSAGWALIRQTDHAWVAGQLARFWHAACAQRGTVPEGDWETVLSAVDRHDDGWQARDDPPLLDEAQGRPFNFLEVPDQLATCIWRQSIESVSDLGPLAQYLVAGHFVKLRQNSVHQQTTAARRFITEFEPRCEHWLSQWSDSSDDRRPELAQAALEQLQRFDFASLWLCGAIETELQGIELPGGPLLEWMPPTADGDADQDTTAERRIAVQPWPLPEPSIRWSVPARYAASECYSSAAELVAASHPMQLHWTLQPA